MTLAEFLAPLAGGSQREQCLAVLYYQQRYQGKAALTVEEVRAALIRARVPRASKINVADVLNKSGGTSGQPRSSRQAPTLAADHLWRKAHPNDVKPARFDA